MVSRWLKPPRGLIMAFLTGLLIVQLIGLALWQLAWPAGAVELSFVVPLAEANDWQPLIAMFEAENPDIRLRLVAGNYNTDQVKAIYTADLSSGAPQHDLVYMDVIWLPWFASEGWLQDLSGEFLAAELEEFLPSELAAGRYQGHLYRMPFRADIGLLLYNPALLNGAIVPESFTELVAAAETAMEGEAAWGYLWQGREYEGLVANFVEVLQGYGGFWIDPETQTVGLDEPEAIAAAAFLANTIRGGISPPLVTSYDETESFNQFVNEESPFLRSWPYFWQQAAAEIEVGVAPVVAAEGISARGCRGGWGFGMPQQATHPEAAKRAIAFFTSAKAQRAFVLNSGHLPSREALYTDQEILERYPFFPEILAAIVQGSVFRPQIPQYDQASQILQQSLWQVLVGEATPTAAMEQAAAATQELLR